jgi:uncharacterized RDD family membrane protein YckC
MSTDPPPIVTTNEVPGFSGYSSQPGDIEGVSFWPRACARIIDTILYLVVGYCAGILFAVLVFIAAAGRPDPLQLAKMTHPGIIGFVVALLASVAFHTICESVHGSTPGKLVFSMVVVQEDGSPCRPKGAFIRSLGCFVDSLFFGLIGYFAMQKSIKEQRHGDEWAHTIVCKRSLVSPQNLRGTGKFMMGLFLAIIAHAALIMTGLVLALIS